MGSTGDEVVGELASHQCGPGSNSGINAICGLSLLLVLSLAPRGFSPGTPVLPSPQKPRRRRTTMWMCYLQIVIFFLYYLCNVSKFLLYLHFLTGNCTVMKPTTSKTTSVRDTKKVRSGNRGDHTSYYYLLTSLSCAEASL